MISNVYNYYMSEYGHKVNSRQDSHTKTQLKNTYSKVIKINSQTPTYKTDVSEAAQKYAIDLKENARELSYIANELSNSKDGSIAYKKSALSSNESAIHADYIRSDSAEESEGFDILVSQLATQQVNTSNYLQPNSSHITAGTYSFDLSINNVTYEFEFNVDDNEATTDVQNKISRLINRSNIGLHSEVLTDGLNNTAISITSDSTGVPDANQSTIFKITPNQDMVNTLGLDRVTQHPSNAIVEINGQTKISPSNDITIDKAFSLTLKDTTDEPVTISLQTNADSVAQSIEELMSGYNNMLSVTSNESNSQFEGNARLHKEFTRIAQSYKTELEKNGITVGDDGDIHTDTASIKSAADSGSLSSVFKSLNAFKQAIQRKSDDIAINPMNYVNNKIVAYKNPEHPITDPYNLSAYTGMMFNDYI